MPCAPADGMHDPLKAAARAWLAAGRPAMVVQVLSTRGSVPRGAGTRMLVAADVVTGTIGGGHLELQAIDRARALLAGGLTAPQDQAIALGPTLGQCCGGSLVLRTAPLDASALAAWPDEPALFSLQLHGAGHVGRAIVRLLHDLPCTVQWIDGRGSEFPAEPDPPHIARLCVDAAEAEVDNAPPGGFFLVLTHSHDLDLAITQAILRRGDVGYLGLIGSATKRARFTARLRQRGIDEDRLARMTCPIGVPGIPGKQPAQIAVAVVAQLLQVAAARSAVSPG